MSSALGVLAEPRRLEILRLVWVEELTVSDIGAEFSVTQSAISQHLKVLLDAGLVTVRKQGRERRYRAVPDAAGELRPYLESYWGDGLARLKVLAELEARQRGPRAR